ncbi:AMP-binding protein [Streptomyces lincolnensis]|uniref:AMP-binding protein n=1 Tax=Streptomyces lincolnensis TaxID=1915 RepID=UPI0027E31BCE|nr:AMP-binding protein [Streptomyces lincolnensis]MCD7439746.1 AMP-binding protein [Streptomyces lincolnensis]
MPLRDLSPHDQRLFRQYGHGPAVPLPDPLVHHAVERHATQAPHTVAAEHLGGTITYGELNRYADALAVRLAREGVRPGDHVGLFVRRSIPMLVGLLGILKSGAAYVPQDIGRAPRTRLAHVVHAAGTRVVLTVEQHAHRVPLPAGHRLIALDGPLPRDPRRGTPRPGVSPDDGCHIHFTDGADGRPHPVKVTHRNIANLLLTGVGGLGIRPGDRVAQLLDLASATAAWEILGCLAHGGTLVIGGEDTAAARTADVIVATPAVLSGLDPATCPRVRTVAVAADTGAPCPRPLADRWARRTDLLHCWGPTGTPAAATPHRHDPAAPLLTLGRPTPNNTVYVLDAGRRPLPIGETGELWTGGDCVPAALRPHAGLDTPDDLGTGPYAPDPFLGGDRRMARTGALGRWTPDGELEHLGRIDEPAPHALERALHLTGS